MIEKYKFLCVAELINAQTNSGILFRLSFNVPHITDKHNVLEPAENIGISLEPWAWFVNIVVSEILQDNITI